MDAAAEQKLLASLYDRLHDAVTYAPEGKTSNWKANNTYFQMAKNYVLDPNDFKDMQSPANPEGDLATASTFTALVDQLPTPGALWSANGGKVTEVYRNILAKANAATAPDPEKVKQYEQAYNFLNTEVKVKSATGEKTKTVPSEEVLAYEDAQAAYIAAVTGYRNAYNGYDLTKKEDQRAWNAVAPNLQMLLNQAWSRWGRAGKAEVEEAEAILASTINDAVRSVISAVQASLSDQHLFEPQMLVGYQWIPSYALPTSWTSIKGSKFTLKSTHLNKNYSSFSQEYSAKASGSWGLWHAAAEVGGGSTEKKEHMDAQNFTLDAELIFVSIQRPWFSPLLLGMKGWNVSGTDVNGISNGNLLDPKGIMPLVPTGFVIARDAKMTADFSESDKKDISFTIESKAEIGWGPFSASGGYKQSSSSGTFTSKFDGATLTLPGLQLVAWMHALTPASPPLKG
jgi:hypothetical protein